MAPSLARAGIATLCYAFLSLSAVLCMDEAVEDECRAEYYQIHQQAYYCAFIKRATMPHCLLHLLKRYPDSTDDGVALLSQSSS